MIAGNCKRYFLILSAVLAATSAFGQSLEERYWLALNEGRDLSKLQEVVARLAGPGGTIPPNPGDRAEAIRMLDVIENTLPITEITVDAESPIPQAGADWPSMGGKVAHTGHTT